jgi:predicted lipoprotein with Yx(FWY)xxD motif
MGEEEHHRTQEVYSMKRLLITGAALVAAAVVLAGCGGGGSTSSPSATKMNGRNSTVSVKRIGGAGSVLVDKSGQALYQNDQETRGMVLCDGACLSFWTPLTVSGAPKGSSITGKLGVMKRSDGTKQVTYNGKPLYSFYLDSPGEVSGDGVADAFGGRKFTWHVVHSGKGTSSSGGASTPQSGPFGY